MRYLSFILMLCAGLSVNAQHSVNAQIGASLPLQDLGSDRVVKGGYAKPAINYALKYNYQLTDRWSVGLDGSYSQYGRNTNKITTDLIFLASPFGNTGEHKTITLLIGPVYHILKGKWQLDGYLKAGAMQFTYGQYHLGYQDGNVYKTVKIPKSKTLNLTARGGFAFKYQISQRFDVGMDVSIIYSHPSGRSSITYQKSESGDKEFYQGNLTGEAIGPQNVVLFQPRLSVTYNL